MYAAALQAIFGLVCSLYALVCRQRLWLGGQEIAVKGKSERHVRKDTRRPPGAATPAWECDQVERLNAEPLPKVAPSAYVPGQGVVGD